MTEALVLAIIGGIAGALIAYLFFNGYTASTWGGTFSQVSFDFAVTTELITNGIVWSCILGLTGGLFPGHFSYPATDYSHFTGNVTVVEQVWPSLLPETI